MNPSHLLTRYMVCRMSQPHEKVRRYCRRIRAERSSWILYRALVSQIAVCFFFGRGDMTKSIRTSEQALDLHELPSMYFDAFRPDPRYGDLMHRIGLA